MELKATSKGSNESQSTFVFADIVADAKELGFTCERKDFVSPANDKALKEQTDLAITAWLNLMWYREKYYQQDRWKKALPQMIFQLLETWEQPAVVVAIDSYLKQKKEGKI